MQALQLHLLRKMLQQLLGAAYASQVPHVLQDDALRLEDTAATTTITTSSSFRMLQELKSLAAGECC